MDSFLGTDSNQEQPNIQISPDILKKFCMHFRSTLFAVVVVVVELIFGFVTHAQTMLPDFTRLALHHEFTSIRVILYSREYCESDAWARVSFETARTCAPTHTPRNTLLLLLRFTY